MLILGVPFQITWMKWGSLEENIITEFSHVDLNSMDQQSCMVNRGSNNGVAVERSASWGQKCMEESGKETFFPDNVNEKANVFVNCFRRCW